MVRSERVVTPEGVEAAAVHVDGEEIVRVAEWEDVPDGAEIEDVGESVVMAGLVDSHVHINEPGRTHWEGFETATRAGAAGGVTTLVDMPLNSVPTTTDLQAFEEKLAAARGKCRVDVGFWGGVVPGNSDDLPALHEGGVLGFKCFRIDSGIDEFEHVSKSDLEEAMPVLAELGTVLLAHAEMPEQVDEASSVWDDGDPRSYSTYLASRPPEAEQRAIEQMLALCAEFDCPVHIVHLATPDALRLVRDEPNAPMTVETCPHYLTFEAGEIPDGAVEFKCAPPIRGAEDRASLWEELGEEGGLALVATDHSPSPPERKFTDSGGFDDAWGGISSLQVALPAVWTGARRRGYGLEDLSRWMSLEPARLAGVDDRKGTIEPGRDADFVVWNPDESFEVRAEELEHRHPITPYDGLELEGVVERTYVRGTCVYRDGQFLDESAGAPLLHRADALTQLET